MFRLFAIAALAFTLASCAPMQANQIERMGNDARLQMLEKRSDQELCNAFTSPYIGPASKAQIHGLLEERGVQECHGKFGAHAYVTPPKKDKTKYKTRELTKAEKATIARVIKQGLKDPDSAKFRWVPYRYPEKGAGSYCGYVNAKNSYGGYTGFEQFHVLLVPEKGGIEAVMPVIDGWAYCEEYR